MVDAAVRGGRRAEKHEAEEIERRYEEDEKEKERELEKERERDSSRSIGASKMESHDSGTDEDDEGKPP